jgi:hypothetical protein
MRAMLESSFWLQRTLRVDISDLHYVVRYSGHGVGYESVSVNSDRATVVSRSYLWYVSLFTFRLGALPAAIEVRVWPWLAVRSFHLVAANQVLYGEGKRGSVGIRYWREFVPDTYLEEARHPIDQRVRSDPPSDAGSLRKLKRS